MEKLSNYIINRYKEVTSELSAEAKERFIAIVTGMIIGAFIKIIFFPNTSVFQWIASFFKG